jgi:hypothetical protein
MLVALLVVRASAVRLLSELLGQFCAVMESRQDRTDSFLYLRVQTE